MSKNVFIKNNSSYGLQEKIFNIKKLIVGVMVFFMR